MALWAARRGGHGRGCLEVAHGNYLPLPDLESEGAGSPSGGWHRGRRREAAHDPDEAGAEDISLELAGQLATRIVPG